MSCVRGEFCGRTYPFSHNIRSPWATSLTRPQIVQRNLLGKSGGSPPRGMHDTGWREPRRNSSYFEIAAAAKHKTTNVTASANMRNSAVGYSTSTGTLQFTPSPLVARYDCLESRLRSSSDLMHYTKVPNLDRAVLTGRSIRARHPSP